MKLQLIWTRGRALASPPSSRGVTRSIRYKAALADLLVIGVALAAALSLTQTAYALDVSGGAADTEAKPVVAERPHHPRENTFMKRQWGVEPIYVRQTAAGYMLEFRYKVVDPEKAAPLFERRTKPVLTHVESGAKLIVPTPAKTGALRNSNEPLAGRVYWMFFANPGQLVKPGDHVDIEIGAFRLEGAVVQ
jgi:hypothetical protein